MREGWEYKKLGEVGTFQRGKGIQKTDFVEKGMPCIHYGQLHTVFGVATEKHLSHISRELYSKSIIASKNDVILALTSEDVEGSCRSTAWLGDYDVAISSDAAVYKHSINPKFVAYYLRSDSFFIEKSKYARGFKVTHIKTSDIEKIPIPLPSLEVQQKVVAELDQINDLIRLKKEQLKEYDNLAQSIFYDMFGGPVENEKGWEVKKLKDVSKVKIGPFGSLLHVEDYVEGGYPVINPVHMNGGRIVADMNFSVNEEKYKELSSYVLKENDIVFGRRGDIGRCALVSKDEDGFICGTGSLFVRFCIEVDTTYILKMLLTNSMKGILISKAKGATMLNINCGIVENLQIPLPPLPLQQEFSSRIEQIEKLKAEVQKTITDLETLLASRMQYWFE